MNKQQLEIRLYELMSLEKYYYEIEKDTTGISEEIERVVKELKNR